MVKVFTWLVRDVGLSPTWFQFFSLKNCTDGEEYIYIIITFFLEEPKLYNIIMLPYYIIEA